jgi:hypothetical protein
MRLASPGDSVQLNRRRGRIERKGGEANKRAFTRKVTRFMIATRCVAAMHVVINDVIEAINELVHGRDQIRTRFRYTRKLLCEVMAAHGSLSGELLKRFAPPLKADLAQHRLFRVEGALKFLI